MEIPIILSSTETVTVGQVKALDQGELGNPFAVPTLIDEIRFTVSKAIAAGCIRANLRLGTTYLTHNFVPVWLFDRVYDAEDNFYVSAINNPMTFAWKLPKPLLVGAGELLVTRVQHAGGGGTAANAASITVRASYVGRAQFGRLPRGGHALPWVSSWIGATRTDSDTRDASKQTDLHNPFGDPLKLHRMNGRIQFSTVSFDSDCLVRNSFAQAIANRWTHVQIRDQAKVIVVRDKTPFSHLFQATTRSWKISGEMAPKGFYLVDLDQEYADIDGSISGVIPQIALVGYREVSR